MRSEQQNSASANGADSAANNSAISAANGGVAQTWRRNYVPYQEAAAEDNFSATA